MPLSKIHLLTLLNTPKIGQVTVKAINENANFKVTNISDLQDLIIDTKQQRSKIQVPQIEELLQAYNKAQIILDKCENLNIKAISINESDYPIKLFRLPDAPIIIYVKGNINALGSDFAAAVIGTREPSGYGMKVGRRIAGILAKNGFSIISGLAIGCDTAGHLGALDAHAQTIAVLASGVDIIYPKENQALAQRIVENGGALLSEYEPGMRPQKSSFVERDRLQAGLSNGVVVVETDIQGGTMHAVRCAQKMDMPLACLTGHPEHLSDFPKIQGNKYLLNSGASPLGNADQIFSFIKKMNPQAVALKEYAPIKDSLPITLNSENIHQHKSDIISKPVSTDSSEYKKDLLDENLLGRIIRLEQQVSKLLDLQNDTIKLLHTFISSQESKENSPTSKNRKKKNSDTQPKLL